MLCIDVQLDRGSTDIPLKFWMGTVSMQEECNEIEVISANGPMMWEKSKT